MNGNLQLREEVVSVPYGFTSVSVNFPDRFGLDFESRRIVVLPDRSEQIGKIKQGHHQVGMVHSKQPLLDRDSLPI